MLHAVLLVVGATADVVASVVDAALHIAPLPARALLPAPPRPLLPTQMPGASPLLQMQLRQATGQPRPNRPQRQRLPNPPNPPHQLSRRRRRGHRCLRSQLFLHPSPSPRNPHPNQLPQKKLVLHQVRFLISLRLHTQTLNLKKPHNRLQMRPRPDTNHRRSTNQKNQPSNSRLPKTN